MDSKGREPVAKAKTSKTSKAEGNAPESQGAVTDQKTVEAKIAEDVVDAEIIEEVSADAEETVEVVDSEEEPVESSETSEAEVIEETVTKDSAETEEVKEESKADAEDTPAAEKLEATEPTPTAAQAPVKKTGFVPVALGGVVAAALGFGLSQYVGPLSGDKDEALMQLESLVQTQSEQIEQLLTQQAEIRSMAEASQGAIATTNSGIDGLGQSMTEANGRIDDVAGALATLDGRITVIEKKPITQSLPSAAIEAYEREVEELKAAVASQRAEAASMEENAQLTAQQALARAALSRVQSALDAGTPYRVALTDLAAATGGSPGDLEAFADTGVVSLATLQDDFPSAARAALAAARQSEGGEIEGNKLTSFFKAQLGARSVTPQEGNSADAILSRAEDALRAGRVGETLVELDALPDGAKAAFEGWIAAAQSRQAAFAAADALSEQLKSN
ncbi:hypothetical protein TA5114_00321 [Cognatishimia activa]|uniref:Mitochondrial inner membrane protein n=1 Tax=Cognatishimia activa TaxID=1715691 RepID=A0A0N7MB64_9RHOB|nr:hypothetical protein TA5113_00384 [Cognatishimia activa]CUK24536.1 hypothetical protein TA5114_00321 [Cognatishimia activa]